MSSKRKKSTKKKQIKENEDWKDKYLRAVADYQNLENRIKHQIGQITQKANERLILRILEVVDDIEIAEGFVKDEGLKIIKDKFYKILEDEGVEVIDIKNKEFDPVVAEAVGVVEGTKDNIVKEIDRKGYMLHGSVLRPARVKVTKKSVK